MKDLPFQILPVLLLFPPSLQVLNPNCFSPDMASGKVEKGKMDSESPITPVLQQYPASADAYDVDYEKHGASRESNPLPDLKRRLKSRHLQMIAIGE